MLAELIIRHGETVIFDNVETEDGKTVSLNIAQYIDYNLSIDGLSFQNPLFARVLKDAVEHSQDQGFSAEQFFLNHEDIEISRMATSICMDQYRLLEERKKTSQDEEKSNEEKREEAENRITDLRKQTEHLLNDFRMDYVEQRMKQLQSQITQAAADPVSLQQLLEEYKMMHELRSKVAKLLGNNIIV